ncbi:WhiB family transcriptional regulator [Rhodococcus indonesiensis]
MNNRFRWGRPGPSSPDCPDRTTPMKSRTSLPVPLVDRYDWQLRARCRGIGSETFFAPAGETRSARTRRERAAKQICAVCPVVDQCRTHAVNWRERFGVWGGMTAAERAAHRTSTAPITV